MAGKQTVTGTLTGPVRRGDKDDDGTISYGDSVSFEVASIYQLFVNVLAHQNDVLVMNSWAPYFPTRMEDPEFGLYSPSWLSGGADCIANLVHLTRQGKYETIDSVTFTVAA